ncbi:uncharacterized protein LACBIDRAFT_325787 [Laccaria bicolor S238N-H82]|uniref:Predicted protein n=1 Tax=Laccaria bicolor (strain S238N-H82 / ATCC MYA-4686) TaxID=486041 RepID=B0D677_LACBS|nr:uncharacterized protein LACBIDRAFT_325787 [Laccaria bicolor S238N-H82]EDR10152.1 predicted protein [Laccaria bicolor S238N-H82]|eukprot:XP_001879537.1 predicted protein [Laccaria bicolor S238N-H82]
MLTHKKKSITSLQQIYDSIMGSFFGRVIFGPTPQVKQELEPSDQLAGPGRCVAFDWGLVRLIGKCEGDDAHVHLAALRLAVFRLVEAGLETKPGIYEAPSTGLLHELQLASKTGVTLSGPLSTPDVRIQFEEQLRNAGDPDTCATIVWKEGNYTVAEFMSKKITGGSCTFTLV